MLVALLAVGASGYGPLTHLVLAVRLTLGLQSLASGATGQDLPVLVRKVSRQRGNDPLDGFLYQPADSLPARAVVLVAGVSELGCYHPRLMALSRFLANKGFLVLTPDIRMFRRFEISPEALEEIAFWFEQVKTLEGSEKVRQVGLAGISFSGTLALIAAARPGIRNRVAYVLSIGGYDDPLRCSREWFAAGPVTVSPGYYPTRFYAKWIIMLTALNMLSMEEERRFLHGVLIQLLLQRELPPLLPGMTLEGERWYRLAIMREDQSDDELARQIESYLAPRLYQQITPDRACSEVFCPIFLVHGAHDDLIPPEESRRLRRRIVHAKSYLLVSPFLTHTHPLEKPLSWRDKAGALADILGFFYSFARVV